MSLRADNAAALKALDMPAATVRLYLLYGPDEAGSEALAARFGKGMGQGAERIDLDGPNVSMHGQDPSLLGTEQFQARREPRCARPRCSHPWR